MLSARFLGPSGYGLITYTASVVAFAAPLMYLGFTSVLVQELIAHPEKEGETLGTAIFSGLISGVLCIGGACAFVAAANRTREALIVCALYSTILLFQGMEMIIYWFQARASVEVHLADIACRLCHGFGVQDISSGIAEEHILVCGVELA